MSINNSYSKKCGGVHAAQKFVQKELFVMDKSIDLSIIFALS